jgi:hypothetical protein
VYIEGQETTLEPSWTVEGKLFFNAII